jgi:outer membrane lipoprotein SlyB
MITDSAVCRVNLPPGGALSIIGLSLKRGAAMGAREMSHKAGILILALTIAACAGGLGGRDYDRGDTRQAYKVEWGKVASVTPVEIEGQYTELGTVGGGAVGYSLGRIIGDGSGSRVAGAIGGVAGAVAGREIEKAATSDSGLEIMVDLDRGDTLVIVQSADVSFQSGERVRILFGAGNEARVVKP